ncbi:MAG: DUF4412 domain-containing protein [Bacteroidota bacterium]
MNIKSFLRLLRLSTVAFLLFAVMPAWAQGKKGKPVKNFEGIVNMKLSISGANSEMFANMLPGNIEYKFKEGDVRVAMDRGMVKDMLVREGKGQKKEIFSLDADSKVAYQFDSKALNKDPKKKGDPDAPKVTPTTETEEIAGYKCKKSLIEVLDKASGMKITGAVWTSDEMVADVPDVQGLSMFSATGSEGFPLKIEMNIMMFTITMQAKEVLKKTLEAAEFVIPKGYEVKPYKPGGGMLQVPGLPGMGN